MRASFNLVDEPWIPCVLLASGERRDLSLRDTLARAAEIREIDDPSPLVTVALHRLLLAILHRNVGPAGLESWHTLWSKGAWDSATLGQYLDTWRHRFELFDAERPFYQAASLDFQYEKPIATLTHELASGNNTTLFDHTTEAARPVFSAAQAARRVVAFQSFALSGLVSFEKGQDRNRFGSAIAAPLVKGAVAMIKGGNLFETLMLNAHAYNAVLPFKRDDGDLPAWERDDETVAGDRFPTGYLDLLTWQSRRILLHPEPDTAGHVMVRSVVIMKGTQFPESFSLYEKEPMFAFRRNLKAKGSQDPFPVVGFQEERAVWRDSHVLFQSTADLNTRPMMLDWLNDLVSEGYLDRSQTVPLEMYGLCADRASVLFWRHERLQLPLAYLNDRDLFDKLREALTRAEDVGRNLRSSIWLLATLSLAPDSDNSAARQPATKDISNLADSLDPTRFYWARLQANFMDLLRDLADARAASSNAPTFGNGTLADWASALRTTAWAAFVDVTRGMDASARSLKAIASAERRLNGLLNETLKGYAPLAQGGAA